MTADGRQLGDSSPDCVAVDELLPAYALDGLDDVDRAFVDEHLLGCDRHGDLATFQAAATWIGEGAPEMEPPTGLRERVLAIPRSSAHETAAPSRDALVPSLAPAPVASGPILLEERRGSAWRPYALAAVFAALALFMGAWNVMLQSGDDGSLVGEAVAGNVSSRVVYLADDHVAVAQFAGLDELPAGSDYQLWTIAPDGAPVSAGILHPQAGSAALTVPGEFGPGSTFAVTVEPDGGSVQPTTSPIVAATF